MMLDFEFWIFGSPRNASHLTTTFRRGSPNIHGSRPTLCGSPFQFAIYITVFCALASLSTFAAAPSREETRLYRIVKQQHAEGLPELSAAGWKDFFAKFPRSAYADEARLLWAESLVRAEKPAEAVKILEERLDAKPPVADRWLAGYQFWLAEAQLKLGDFKRASELYRSMLRAHPQSPLRADALYGHAIASLKLQQLNEAEGSLREAIELAARKPIPTAPAARMAHENLLRHMALLRGEIWMALDKLENAVNALEEFVKQNPDHPSRHEATRWLGEILLRQGKLDEAIEIFRAVLAAQDATTPLKADVWLRLGKSLALKQQWQQSADAFGECLKLASDPALRGEALTRRAESLIAADNKPLAVEELRAFSEKNEKDPLADDALLWAADLLFEGRSPKLDPKILAEALKLYQTLPARFPQSPLVAAARHGAGWCLLALKREGDAAIEFAEAAKSDDRQLAAESQLKLGDTLFALKRYDDAAAAYADYCKRFEDGAQFDTALFQRGVCLAFAGKTAESVQSFERLAAKSPPTALSEAAAFEIGRARVMGQDFEGAQSAFEKFIEMFGATSALADEARLAIAQSLYRRGKFDEARAKLQELVARVTDEQLASRARYELAWSCYQSGDVQAARQQFEELLQKYPASAVAPEVAAWLADQAYRQRDLTGAQEKFAAVAANYPTSEWADAALLTAGRIAHERGENVEAFKLLETLQQKYPHSRLQADALFLQAECRVNLQQFENAVSLFDIIIARFPDTPLAVAALGRKGDCLETLGKFEDAARSYQRLIEHNRADADALCEARYKLGVALEKMGRLNEALAQFANVVYGWRVDDRDRAARDDTWFCRAAFRGAELAIKLSQPKVGVRLLEHVVGAQAGLSEEAERLIRSIKLNNAIFP
jgi:TolA-binding protein